MEMSVLVTGGSGFIGCHLVDKLLEKGFSVRVFDTIQPSNEKVEWIKGDLLNEDDVLKACRDVETIFHLAAIADVNVALSHPELCLKVNEVGTLNVLRSATALEAERIVLASTIWVYGTATGTITEETPLPPPDHIYTKTKIGQEHLLIAWEKQNGLPYTILRYGIPYGPRMRSNMAIATFVRRAINKEPITIFGDGNQGRNFIYTGDIAEGNVVAMKPQAKNQIVNIAGSEFVTINQIVEALQKIFGELKIEHKPARPGDLVGAEISIEKAEKLLNWKPKTSFKEGLKKYIESTKTT
jgi:UDP-glucose 4-epimerase